MQGALLSACSALVAALLVMASAPLVRAGELTVTPSLDLRETFTDNVDLENGAEAESAFVSEVTPGLRVRSTSARVIAGLDAFPTIRHQTAGDDKGVSLDLFATGLSELEVVDDRFFVEAEASVSEQVLSNRAEATAGNRQTVQVYRLSPFVRSRLGGFADAELRYRLSQVLVEEGQDASAGLGTVSTSDATTHTGLFGLASGPDFNRLAWLFSALVSESDLTDDDDISRQQVDLGLEYAVLRSLSLIVGGGYQVFDDGEPANEINSPTWRTGFRWRPGPRTELLFTYGERDDELSPAALFRYDIGPRTRLTLLYEETLGQAQERLPDTLGFLDLEGETDDFIDERTNLDFDPHPGPFDIDDETTRVKTLQMILDGVRGRNSFTVIAAYENEEVEPTGEQEDVVRATARWSRQLNRRLTFDLWGGYDHTEFDDGRKDDEYFVSSGLTYRLYSNLQTGLAYGFTRQYSTRETSEFVENRVVLSLRATF